MVGKTLFHGGNEDYLSGFGLQDLPVNWTSCAYDALNHSWNSARRHSANMKVLVFPDAPLENFHKTGSTMGCRCDLEWFVHALPLRSPEEIKTRIKIYNESDLKRFLIEYLDEDHLDYLKATKIYERITGMRAPEPGYHQLQVKKGKNK